MTVYKPSKPKGFGAVLCAVDFSPLSTSAMRTAMEIAGQSGGRVTALCVEDPLLGQGAAAVGYDTAQLRRSTIAQLRRLVRRVAATVRFPAEACAVDTALGHPAPAILATARKIHADLIVMGTHARRGPTKFFFGSTAQGVLRRATTPVLIVPRRRRQRKGATRLAGGMLGAIDLGPASSDDVRRTARAAARLGLPLTLLHVVPATPSPRWFASELADHERDRLLAAAARLSALAGSVKSRSKVVLGQPDLAIPAVAAETKAAVIALTLRRGRGLFGRRQGSTTYQVLCGATIPVLALPGAAGRRAVRQRRTHRER